MLITTTDKPPKVQTYPYLGICKDREIIVLFDAPETGIIIALLSNHTLCRVGERLDTWREELFTPYSGVVTLQNTVKPLV